MYISSLIIFSMSILLDIISNSQPNFTFGILESVVKSLFLKFPGIISVKSNEKLSSKSLKLVLIFL